MLSPSYRLCSLHSTGPVPLQSRRHFCELTLRRRLNSSSSENNAAGDDKEREREEGVEDKALDEETIARLQKAEAETERLRKELSSLRANQSKQDVLARAGRTLWSSAPFDSKDLRRETIFESNNKTGNWLSEADVEFITGESENGLSAEAQAIINRRLAIGGVLTSLFLIFALIPSEKFQIFKPRGTAADYLIPVLRSQDLLSECGPFIEDADWQSLRLVIDRIVNMPNKLKKNLDAAVAFLKDSELRRRGRGLSSEVMEFVQGMDYNNYFEDRLNQKEFRGGAEEARFVEFSRNSLQTANKRLTQFLALFPSSEIAAARKSINSIYNETI